MSFQQLQDSLHAAIVADPFMADHEPVVRRPGDFKRDRHGTPSVSDPSGDTVKTGKRKGEMKWVKYSRPSSFAKIIEDMYSIHKWDQRQQVYGFAVDPDLVDRARILLDIDDRESQAWKDEADKIAKAAKLAAKASLAADRGSHAHLLAEDDDEDRDIITRLEAGEDLGLSADVQRSLVAAWRKMLERDGLEILAVEMPVVNDLYRAAGTLDRVARLTKPLRFRLCTGELITLPAGLIVILDIKSGKRRLNPNGTVMYWHGYAVQVFLYGPTSFPYDTATETRGKWEWELSDRWALIAHLDVLGAIDGNPSCDLILVDLLRGRAGADLCVAAKRWGGDQTVFSVAQIVEGEGGPVHSTESPAPSTPIVEGGVHDSPSPSTLSPVVTPPPAAGEGAGVSSGTTPSPASSRRPILNIDELRADPPLTDEEWEPFAEAVGVVTDPTVNDLLPRQGMPQHALDEIEVDRLNDARRQSYSNWPLPDPRRLTLVDARAALCPSPDEGADWSGELYRHLWIKLKALFDDLDPVARQWRSELAGQAKRRRVDFLAQGGKTERRYWINKAVICLALSGDYHDAILRELLAHIIGDVALMLGVEAGHALGSLSAAEAERFAAHVDAYLSPLTPVA